MRRFLSTLLLASNIGFRFTQSGVYQIRPLRFRRDVFGGGGGDSDCGESDNADDPERNSFGSHGGEGLHSMRGQLPGHTLLLSTSLH